MDVSIRQMMYILGKKRTHYLFLGILRTRNEIHGLHMPYIDLVTEDVSEDDLGDISGHRWSVGISFACETVRTSSSDIRQDFHLHQ